VNEQRTALADIQKELAMTDADRLGIQEELVTANDELLKTKQQFETAKKAMNTLDRELSKFRGEISDAVGRFYHGKFTSGNSKVEKIEVLKKARTDLITVLRKLATTTRELEDVRKERDGIYKTLDVRTCLGAHLTIGDLKLTQLDCEVLRKALGDFEDEAAVHEIKRLKKANLELVKVESALDGVDGDSNVARIDNLKTANKMG
jgi:chromosome segregation ATPase